ncbi:MAG: DMT family transporter [Arenibacterium sp.]
MVETVAGRGVERSLDNRNIVLSGNTYAVISMVLWASGFPAAELLLDQWHPIALMAARLAMALLVLVPLWLVLDGVRSLHQARWGRGLWIGAVGFGTGTNLLLFAQWYTDPVTVALIATTTPISATLIEVWNRQRRLNQRFVLGLMISVFGGIVAIGGSLSFDFGWGVLLAITSGFCFTWASNAAVRDLPDLTPTGRSTVTFVGAALITFAVFFGAWSMGWAAFPIVTDPNQIGLLGIYAIAAMALSQILFIASVGKLGIALTSLHLNIAPLYLMIILVVLGGAWDWRAVIGASIVGLGVLLSQRRTRPQRADGRV